MILRGKDVKKIVKLKVRWVYDFPSFVIFRPIIQVGDTKFGNYPYNEISFLKKKHIFNRNDLTYMIIACIELQDFLN